MNPAAHPPDPYLVDWARAAGRLVRSAREEADWYAALAGALTRPGDRLALDVGCGGAGMAAALAWVLGPEARVVAIDADPQVLAAARADLATADPTAAARITFVQADLNDDVTALRKLVDGPADLVWASSSVHHVGDQQAAVTELAALLAPGGRLALAEGGLPSRHLPWDLGVGEPGLELRLDAAANRWFAGMRAELPGSTAMPYGWTEALRRAGLTQVTTRTTLLEHPTPLDDAARGHVIDTLAHSVDRLRDTGLLDRADIAVWDRLCDPADPVWLGHRTDLHWLRARSVHVGTRP
jgi:SAM-dependent methyltransferase